MTQRVETSRVATTPSDPSAAVNFARRRTPDRMLRTLVIALPLVVLIGLLPKRPSTMVESGITQRELYEMKYSWPAKFDTILAGNSRVTVGLAPTEMTAVLSERRIGNFGFDGNAFTKEYLQAIETKLVSSGSRIVVLGITPMTLTDRAARQNGFVEELHRTADDRFLIHHFPRFLSFFARFNPRAALNLVRKESNAGSEFWRGYPDGWAAQSMTPKNMHGQVAFLRRNAPNNSFPISRRLVDHLLLVVRDWKERGIQTLAFRAPTSKELAYEEERASGFIPSTFVTEFTAAGGRWIEVDPAHYETFDGGHLEEASARKFSRDLADEIKRLGLARP